MENQKAEALLNLSLDATQEELAKSQELSVGHNAAENTWEVIIKYSGSLERVRMLANAVVELHGGFAIVTADKSKLDELLALPEVEYAEKPKSLYFEVAEGRRVSCINTVQEAPFSLFGKGVIVAVVDSGIDYKNMDFRNVDGSTRILNLWDQTIPGNPPEGYAIGTEYTREEINAALRGSAPGNVSAGVEERAGGENVPGTESRVENVVRSVDSSGHGTGVAGIAAGNGANSDGIYRGVAPESELLIVKLGQSRSNGFPRTTELMQGLDYVIQKAVEYRKPVAVNVSFGNTYGSHEPYH